MRGYKLAGKVNVPEEKKEEMNKYVIRLLDRCGIRKTEEITLAGKKVTVISPARPDQNGLIWFDYSIFEKMVREPAVYDMNTCELDVPDSGYREFNLTMSMIMVLQESYTNGNCYFMVGDLPCDYLSGYIKLLDPLLGTQLLFENRGRMWEMYHFLRIHEGYSSITGMDILRAFPYRYASLDLDQELMVMDYIDNSGFELSDESKEIGRKDITKVKRTLLIEYLCRVVADFLKEEKEAAKPFFTELLNSDREKRKKIAEQENISGILAEISLYMLPVCFVYAYALAEQNDFWDVWEKFGIQELGYTDIVPRLLQTDEVQSEEADLKEGREKTEKNRIPLYKAFSRDSEDEFLEFWDEEERKLSKILLSRIRMWTQQFAEATVPENFQMENSLSEVIAGMKACGRCRLVDKALVEEFLKHGRDLRYQKALLVLDRQMDRYTELFPELTKRQVIDWILQRNLDNREFVFLSAYLSLLGNRRKRMELFGF